MAVSQSSKLSKIPATRGSIYDRTGTVVLATTVSRDLLAANPQGSRRNSEPRMRQRWSGCSGSRARRRPT